MTHFTTCRPWELPERKEEGRWLVEHLWGAEAVGILGGEPKCCKTFLALELAVSVAAGVPCLRQFAVARRGPVLLYAAEDALPDVRQRLEGLCATRGLSLADLDLIVITEPIVRLDVAEDRRRLEETVAEHHPVLLVLDPFVRLHRVDENVSAQVVPLLAYLRGLQRTHNLAVLVVHHARKGGGRARPGQALRGSSEFHGWGDSNLYLRRGADGALRLEVEHRAAASPDTMTLQLDVSDARAHLELVTTPQPDKEPCPATPAESILDALCAAPAPLGFEALRKAAGVRASHFSAALRALVEEGSVLKSRGGYAVVT